MDATFQDLQASHQVRSHLDQLLEDARLYQEGPGYRELLDFVARMPAFAPFNAMLLNLQKPGLSYAATPRHWLEKFGRRPKEDARPLLVMHPFGPVAIVYDVQDTEGDPLPDAAWSFTARGDMDEAELRGLLSHANLLNVTATLVDAGDRLAGSIEVRARPTLKTPGQYLLRLNRNHTPAVQFGTLVHELAHLCLGHLGGDTKQQIPDRRAAPHAQRELEAESVSYVVSKRRGLEPHSVPYLAQFFKGEEPPAMPDRYEVMRVAGRIERLLGLFSGQPMTKARRPQAAWREEQASLDFGE